MNPITSGDWQSGQVSEIIGRNKLKAVADAVTPESVIINFKLQFPSSQKLSVILQLEQPNFKLQRRWQKR